MTMDVNHKLALFTYAASVTSNIVWIVALLRDYFDQVVSQDTRKDIAIYTLTSFFETSELNLTIFSND